MANPNKDIAIAIIGAGPSGLAAAECLKDDENSQHHSQQVVSYQAHK